MRAAVLVGPGDIRVEERPGRSPGDEEVAVAVGFVGICGSDQARFAGGGASGAPVVLGHEVLGRIAAVGSGVQGLLPGRPWRSLPS